MVDQTSANLDSQHIAEELYKKNLELAEINKALALLRKIDEIILSSVTDIKNIAHQVTDAVVNEAGFKTVYILLKNDKDQLLYSLAVSLNKSITELDPDLQRAVYSLKVPLSDKSSIINQVLTTRQMQKTEKMHDLFKLYLTEDSCKKIQDSAGIKLFHIYPLIVRERAIGVIIFSPKEDSPPFFNYQDSLIARLPAMVSIAIDNALLYENIERANFRLKELDKLKDEFVSLASHELRTPMTAIKSYLWMVLNKFPDLNPQAKSFLEIAAQETEHLIKLVQNMLTISRIESQRLDLTFSSINLFDIVKLAYDTLKIKANEKQINFVLLPFPEKLIINCDKDKISEVLENVIGNAIKYTPNNGTVSIHFTTDKNSALIHVTDSGQGISKDDISKLFQKFGRLEEAKQSRTPGTGLGLYISKQIVDLHKGSIKVESTPGKGTTFSIRLPLFI